MVNIRQVVVTSRLSALWLLTMSHGCVLATGVLLCFLFSGCDYAKGRAAVEQICARDGGLTTTETANVKGFMYLYDAQQTCLACMEGVGKHGFEYIDADLAHKG